MTRPGNAFFAIAIMLSTAPAWAADLWVPDQNACNQQQNTLAIVDCLQSRAKVWDQRLNQAYQAVMASLSGQPQRIAALKTAEQAWVKFKEANCAYQYSQEGTIRQIATAGCILTMTQDRAIELQRELSP